MEDDDLILDWLSENEASHDCTKGHHVIMYTVGVYIVLEINKRPKYIGWFAVSKKELHNNAYKFLCEKEGKWLYRAVHDYEEE